MAKIDRHPAPDGAPHTESGADRAVGVWEAPSGSGVRETREDDDSAPRAPRLADRYEIISLLGSGSMGSVYKAHDLELDEIVALKILRPDLASTPGIIELFRREVKLARRVTHPNVARMFDIGQSSETKFLTMELVDGPSLVALFERGRALGAMRVVEIARAVASGLVAAHASGVVHRDLKPANVLIASDGRVVVTDFGIASAVGQMSEARGQASVGTAPQAPIGSPAYMSPEQVQGLEVDPRSDLYSLGVLIFEGLTGTLPFRGSSFLSLAAARLTQPIPDLTKLRPGLPVGLAAIVERCLARDPADRFDSASDVVIALDEMTAPSLRRTSTLRPPEPLPAAKSLAVLPFLNPGSKETDGIVESLWNDVIDALSTTQGLRVRPSSAVARFTGRRRNPVQAGREVSVDAVVDAMAYVDETGAHVVARLVSVVDGFQLWARRFSERSDDLLALSRRVAVGLSEALTLEPSAVSKRPSLDAETLDLYHRARRAQRTGFAIGFGKAVELYRELILRQPDDATILAGFATSSLWSWFYGAADSERCRTDAERALERALELAPDSLDVHIGRAQLLWNAGRARDAAVELRLTLRIGESLALHEMLGCLMREMGDFELARRALGKALRIDPESLLANLELARLSALEGDWEAADRFMARVTTPADPSLAAGRRRFTMRMALWRRDFEAVRAHVAGGEPTLSDLDQLYRLMARPDGQPLIQDFFNACDRKNTCTRAVAALRQLESEIACMVGDVEWALLAANRAFEAGLIDPMWLAKCPLLESMRSDPRGAKLQALMETRASEVRAVYDAVDRSPVSRRLDWVDEPEDSRS